jgi:serine/threonine protein kinase/Tfp pilus assembly protein PilF
MDQKQSNRVSALLRRVAQLPADEVPAFLDARCSDDPEVRAEVERLLGVVSLDLTDLGDDLASQLTTEEGPEADPVGAQVGPYRLLRRVGEGGMGVVYEAEQETPVRRRVAVKLIKWGMDTRRVVARFESERQALALMSHANIARVYDAGATERGRPYFVMEYVKGEPITDYCDRHRLTTRDRLALFVQVCAGVQHAHQRGVIHRDMKPSNVLVAIEDKRPVPKIIDFGVAKATSHRLTEKTLFTEYGQLVGTPAYMSPEQAEMTPLDVDTRSDVYSLGVLLYELLAGVLPFDSKDLREAGFDEMRRRIREEEPSRPSTKIVTLGDSSQEVAQSRRTDLPSLKRQLRGDLDWITLKALDKDRTRRYDSASELAADIERHLRDEPVAASPPSKVYRLGKFVRRHRIGVGTSVIFVLLLFAFATFMAIERARADREAETATQVSDFLVELFQVSNPSEARGNSVTAREILDKGAEKIESELAGQPIVQGRLMNTMGRAFLGLGLYPDAERLLRGSLKSLGENPRSNELPIAETELWLGSVLTFAGKPEEGETLCRSALAVFEDVLGPNDSRVGIAMATLATALRFQGKFKESGPLYRRALEIQEKALGPDHIDVARTVYALGWQERQTGRREEALAAYERALPILERELGEDAPIVAWCHHDLSVVLGDLGRRDEALEHLEQTLAIQERILDPGHPDLGTTLDSVGILLWRMGRYEEARDRLQSALEIRREALGPEHRYVASSLINLGLVHTGRGLDDPAKARGYYRQAIAIQERTVGPSHPSLAQSLYNLAALERDRGDFSAAGPLFERSVEIWVEAFGEEHPKVADAQRALGAHLASSGDRQAGRRHLERALAFYEKNPPTHTQEAWALLELGSTFHGQDEQRRLSYYEQALREAEARLAPDDKALTKYLNYMALVHLDLGNIDAAEPHITRTLELLGPEPGAHLGYAMARMHQGELQRRRGDLAGARESLEASLAITAGRRGSEYWGLLSHLHRLGKLSVEEGKLEEAREHARRMIRIAEATYGRDHVWSANSIRLLASVELAAGNAARACRSYEDALEIEARIFGPESKRASTLEQYADALRQAGRTTEANAVRPPATG